MTPEDSNLVGRLTRQRTMSQYGNMGMLLDDVYRACGDAAEAIDRLSKSIDLKDAANRQLEADNKRLSAENERLARAWEAKHSAEVKANAEAKVWFDEAQKLRAQIAEAQPVAWINRYANRAKELHWGKDNDATEHEPLYLHPAADAKDAESLRQQRDDLLAAMEMIPECNFWEDAREICRAAIAKVKGGA